MYILFLCEADLAHSNSHGKQLDLIKNHMYGLHLSQMYIQARGEGYRKITDNNALKSAIVNAADNIDHAAALLIANRPLDKELLSSLLEYAAANGKIALLIMLILDDAPINQKNNIGRTPLMYLNINLPVGDREGVIIHQLNFLNTILSMKADAENEDNEGHTIYSAPDSWLNKTITFMIAANVKTTILKGYLIFRIVETARALLAMDVPLATTDHIVAFHNCLYCYDKPGAEKYLSNNPFLIMTTDNDGNTPLHTLIRYMSHPSQHRNINDGHETLRTLCEYGALLPKYKKIKNDEGKTAADLATPELLRQYPFLKTGDPVPAVNQSVPPEIRQSSLAAPPRPLDVAVQPADLVADMTSAIDKNDLRQFIILCHHDSVDLEHTLAQALYKRRFSMTSYILKTFLHRFQGGYQLGFKTVWDYLGEMIMEDNKYKVSASSGWKFHNQEIHALIAILLAYQVKQNIDIYIQLNSNTSFGKTLNSFAKNQKRLSKHPIHPNEKTKQNLALAITVENVFTIYSKAPSLFNTNFLHGKSGIQTMLKGYTLPVIECLIYFGFDPSLQRDWDLCKAIEKWGYYGRITYMTDLGFKIENISDQGKAYLNSLKSNESELKKLDDYLEKLMKPTISSYLGLVHATPLRPPAAPDQPPAPSIMATPKLGDNWPTEESRGTKRPNISVATHPATLHRPPSPPKPSEAPSASPVIPDSFNDFEKALDLLEQGSINFLDQELQDQPTPKKPKS